MTHNERKEEIRQYPRDPFINFVNLQIGPPFEKINETKNKGMIVNISEGGVCMMVDIPLEISQIVKIDFPLHNVTATTRTLGEVRWIKNSPWSNNYLIGLRFLL
ncbi:MAG: PilZ domain-containing protein [Nitrospirota bacterium]